MQKGVRPIEIQYKKIKDIKPYEKNPRKNDDAVPYVLESKKEYGFKVPIAWMIRWKWCIIQQKAEQLKLEGQDIEILSEDTFYDMI